MANTFNAILDYPLQFLDNAVDTLDIQGRSEVVWSRRIYVPYQPDSSRARGPEVAEGAKKIFSTFTLLVDVGVADLLIMPYNL
jgi:hypothetical protein